MAITIVRESQRSATTRTIQFGDFDPGTNEQWLMGDDNPDTGAVWAWGDTITVAEGEAQTVAAPEDE